MPSAIAITVTVEFLGFLLGLALGLALLGWYRLRLNQRLAILARDLQSEIWGSPASLTSRLTLAIAYQKQLSQQLEQEVETWKQVLFSAPVGYLQVDEDNQLTWCNAQARQILGIQQWESSKPRLLLELVRSYELDQLIEQTRDAQQPCDSEWVFHLSSPDPVSISRQSTCPLRGYGLPLLGGQVGVFLENRQEAATLAQQRDRWISDVAHELKTPLTSIRLVAETLQTRLEPPLRNWIDRLLNEAIRLSNLVQDLLDLKQIERGAPYCLNLGQLNLAELIQSAWLSLEPLARKKHVQLSYHGPEVVLIQADGPRLFRVLLNLLDNSIRYSPSQEAIRVQIRVQEVALKATESVESQVCLEVIDSGPGFPESALPYVFDRFYQVDPSRSRQSGTSPSLKVQTPVTRIKVPMPEKSNGLGSPTPTMHPGNPLEVTISQATTASPRRELHNFGPPEAEVQRSGSSGLGLAIVRQIVEAHQGSVSANNHPETGGAWLQVFLPCQQSHPFIKS
ncbi:cell wall metabolism sensor histidine kinase WalK [Trichocoleus sp. FACHB-591]|uniref:sensor histidine kinase n=1 Tax=Trichocoleus sp. FACHB-591 TaxID=2692872 RepID=UPI0018F04CF3|nr:ATP-binding protein [Trichocoleus sp. FACHB-591]